MTVELFRAALIDGKQYRIPHFVIRTAYGWQVRVAGFPSEHFSDSDYGHPSESLLVAGERAAELKRSMDGKSITPS